MGLWGARAPWLEILGESDTLLVDLDQFVVKLSKK